MRRHVWAAVAVLTLASPVAAQSTDASSWRPWHPVIGIGGTLSGSESLGARTIESRAVTVGTTTPAGVTFVRTDSTLDRGIGGDLVVLLPVTTSLALELRGTAGRRTLTTRLSADIEGASGSAASEQVTDVEIGGRVSWLLPPGPWPRRLRPFIAAGGAYLRQLHEDRILVETGSAWRADLGTHLWLRRSRTGRGTALGATAELGWQWRSGGISLIDGARSSPAAAARLFVAF
ncbi:MAG: hypothetical protein U0P30_11675 [Vicinamibacterales bacterium]